MLIWILMLPSRGVAVCGVLGGVVRLLTDDAGGAVSLLGWAPPQAVPTKAIVADSATVSRARDRLGAVVVSIRSPWCAVTG